MGRGRVRGWGNCKFGCVGSFSVVLFNILVLLPHLWWYRVSLVVLGDYRLLLTATFGHNAMPLRLQHRRLNLFLCAKRGFSLAYEEREPPALVALMRQLLGEMFDKR